MLKQIVERHQSLIVMMIIWTSPSRAMAGMGSCIDIATTLGTSSATDPHGARKVGIRRDSIIVIGCPPLPVVAMSVY